MEKRKVFLYAFAILILHISCSQPQQETRPFYMGFTPWPYAATTEAVHRVYTFINDNGDLVAQHLQQGIPFTAADTADYSAYDEAIRSEIEDRISNTTPGKILYLAIDSLNAARNDLADLWESTGNLPRPSPWDTRNFDDPEVQTSYLDFAKVVIEQFRLQYGKIPEYFNYGTEVSELMINDAAKYGQYLSFAQTIYSGLKDSYPQMKLMISIALKSPGSPEMSTVTQGFAQIRDYVDIVGISTYGYAFYDHSNKGNPDNLPSQWLSQIKTIAPNKPYGVTETGWIGENLVIPAFSLNVLSDEASQKRYLQKLFKACTEEINAQFIIWFTSYDYDVLWTDTLGSDDLSKIWKDTGLIDEALTERSAYAEWKSWYPRLHQ